MVRIRLQKMGRTHRNVFRINAIEKRVKRDGKVLENLGWYDPQAKDPAKQIHLEVERVKHWLQHGAQPSDTMMDMLAARGLVDAAKWKAERDERVVQRKKTDAEKAAAPVVKKAAKKE